MWNDQWFWDYAFAVMLQLVLFCTCFMLIRCLKSSTKFMKQQSALIEYYQLFIARQEEIIHCLETRPEDLAQENYDVSWAPTTEIPVWTPQQQQFKRLRDYTPKQEH